MLELSNTDHWFDVNGDAIVQCVALGLLDFDDFEHRLIALGTSHQSIGRDAADGSLDSHSGAEVEGVISDGKRLIRAIGRKCDIPVN